MATVKQGRNAINGQFVTLKEAKKNPSTTVVETKVVKKKK